MPSVHGIEFHDNQSGLVKDLIRNSSKTEAALYTRCAI
jgi:hypothetical protein